MAYQFGQDPNQDTGAAWDRARRAGIATHTYNDFAGALSPGDAAWQDANRDEQRKLWGFENNELQQGAEERASRGSFINSLRNRFLGAFGGLGSSTGGVGGGQIAPPQQDNARFGVAPVSYNYEQMAPASADHPQLQAPDFTAGNTAAFNRAKDLAGQQTTAGLTSMRAALAARGLTGAGTEAQQTTNVITKGMQGLDDVAREQAIQESQRRAEAARAEYEGGIAQRGQDLQAAQAATQQSLERASSQFGAGLASRGQQLQQFESDADRRARVAEEGYRGGITQRGQDIDARQRQLEFFLSAMRGLY